MARWPATACSQVPADVAADDPVGAAVGAAPVAAVACEPRRPGLSGAHTTSEESGSPVLAVVAPPAVSVVVRGVASAAGALCPTVPATLAAGAQPGGAEDLGSALQAGRHPSVRRRCRLASDHPRAPGRAGSGSGTLHDHSRAGPAGGASSACDDDRHHRLTCAGARAILLSCRPGRAPRRRGAVGRSDCRPHPGAADRRALRAVHRLADRGPATGSRRPVGATGADLRT